ncbi:FirrV-1-B25 [Feldmannia irregularis virus a]|uniref:FirrV-1-B25 n=1 Tax=Feldmannia irregularis virus a TaxID=231992 RepID=Q6XM11_9PHYC|nr:FirrV-1-B25 [Feldmannia irregularis virus a]AAR26900.1 FirrV-1-B25 [Feldmannia irregularis virus a]
MDLRTAFGPTFSPLGTQVDTESPAELLPPAPLPAVPPPAAPEVYVIQVHVSRDDIHLMGVFLLVFIVSLMLNRTR